jgi:hypothetical protein
MKLSPNEMAWCLLRAGFTPEQAEIGVAVGMAESGGDTEVLGKRATDDPSYGNHDHGWLQISNKWHAAKIQATPDWRDPVVNAQLAKQVFDETEQIHRNRGETPNGWKAWAVFGSGSYVKFLPAAELAMAAPWPPPRTTRSLLGRLRQR